MIKEEKLKKIDSVFKDIRKKYGESTLVNFEDKEDYSIERYDIESLSMKYVLGNGLPKSRIIEIYGENMMGKSLISMLLAKDVQDKNNGFVVYLDFEFSFDYSFAKKIGLNVGSDKFKLINPSTIEEGFDILSQISKTGEIALVIWDSTNAAQTLRESENLFGSANMGQNAAMYSQCLKRIISTLAINKTTLIFISQMREKFVLMGDPRVIGVGKAIAFASSIRMEVKRMEWLLDSKKEIIGSKIRLKVIKNKTYPPMRESEIDLFLYTNNPGIDKFAELTEYAIKFDLIKGQGWYTLPDKTKVQGKSAVADYYRKNLDKFEEDKKQVLKVMFNPLSIDKDISEVKIDLEEKEIDKPNE
jgi:recombination protein RecA